MRKRTTTCIIDVWFNTSTMTRGKFELSSASSSRNIRTNNRERIDILTVRLSALAVAQKEDKADRRWRSANTGVEGRRRPMNSHDGASQKPDTPPTPCKDTRRRRLRKPALPAPMSCRQRDGKDDGSGVQWQREEMNSLFWGRRLVPIYIHASQLR